MSVNVGSLVNDGHLDLQAIFSGAEWDNVQRIAKYNNHDDGVRYVMIQRAEAYGIVTWRWIDHFGEQRGMACLDRREATMMGEQYARSIGAQPRFTS